VARFVFGGGGGGAGKVEGEQRGVVGEAR